MALKERLKALRKDKGISQQQVADQLGITRQAYNNYEAGKRKPDTDMLLALSAFFKVSTDYILGKSDDPDSGTSYETPLILKSQQALLDIMEGLSDEKKERLLELAEMLKTVEAVEKDKDKDKK